MGMPTDIGIVDLGMGFPYRSIEQKKAAYDFFKANLKDRESLEEMEFPAQYMFKDVPDVVGPDVDPVQWIVEKMDAFNIEQCMTGLNDDSIRAKAEHPGRFHLCASADPNKGMDTVRQLKRQKDEHGIVGPRMPSWPQHVEQFDEVCYDFPELTMVMMHGGEPWTELAVKLMLKWPGLHYMTSAFAPKHYPKDIIKYANSRGADKIMYCGYFPAGLSLERQFTDMPNVPFKDDVWPKFLRENALRVFKLDQDQ